MGQESLSENAKLLLLTALLAKGQSLLFSHFLLSESSLVSRLIQLLSYPPLTINR